MMHTSMVVAVYVCLPSLFVLDDNDDKDDTVVNLQSVESGERTPVHCFFFTLPLFTVLSSHNELQRFCSHICHSQCLYMVFFVFIAKEVERRMLLF
mmetsp:Transcript_36926/g.41147  ORF Transcript_36926/g.41147 Transcript_36926/m.41147 type:complete len:96 (-) Transcript_36926:781-1068(-)